MTPRDDGVATVVGAILLAAIFASAALTIRTAFVPEWQKQKEAETAMDAGQDLQRLVTTASDGGLASIRLGGGSGILRSLPGDLAFSPDASGLQIAAPEALLWRPTEDPAAMAAETWRNVTGTSNLTNVSSLTGLRLRVLTGISRNHEGDSVHVTALGSDGAVAGSLNLSVIRFPSGFNIHVTVRDAHGIVVYDTPEAYFLQSPIPSFWLDAMRSDLRFSHLLAAANGPFTLNISGHDANSGPQNADLQSQFAATYVEARPSTSMQGGTQTLQRPYVVTRPNGAIGVELHPQRFPAQRWTAEGGALSLSQDEGRVTRVFPDVDISRVGTSIAVTLHVTTFSGDAASISSHRAPVLALSHNDTSSAFASMPSLDVTIRTRDPAMWAEAWQSAAADAGLSPAEHAITITPTTVAVSILGPSMAGDHDVTLAYREVNLLVELRSS